MAFTMIFKDRKFAPLFWTQFLGALNDNFLKNALVVMVTFQNVTIGGLAPGSVVALAGGIFILPFFLFSPLAGQLSDKFEKSRLVRLTKIWELVLMVLAAAALYFQEFSISLGVLFLMGVQATLFGPVKYSALPDLVPPEELVEANAFVELGTFIAILIGTIGSGLAVPMAGGVWWIMGTLLVVAILGVLAAYRMPALPIAAPHLQIQLNPIPSLADAYQLLKEKKAIFNSVLAISWFWFFGAAVLSLLPVYAKDYLGVNESVVTAFLTMFTLGVAIGSVACERLSFRRVEIGLVPIGSLGLTFFLVDIFFVRPDWAVAPSTLVGLETFLISFTGKRLLTDFFGMAFFGGIFIVPLYTLIQNRSHPESRSRVIAANNIVNALFMVISAGCVMTFHSLKMTIPEIFLTLGVVNALVATYIYSVVPEFTLRFLSWVLVHLLYRLRVRGEHHIPAEGPALLVCNHVTYVDSLVIGGGCRRPVRFVMYYKFMEIPLLKYLFKQAKVIPIAGAKEDPALLQAAFDKISQELREGEVVCIFPEGQLTRDGEMTAFRSGVEKIIARDPVPVVPMALQGFWGSFFSRHGGRAFKNLPGKLWSRVALEIASPLEPHQASASTLEAKVKELLIKN